MSELLFLLSAVTFPLTLFLINLKNATKLSKILMKTEGVVVIHIQFYAFSVIQTRNSCFLKIATRVLFIGCT
jgi:hypothetical protein